MGVVEELLEQRDRGPGCRCRSEDLPALDAVRVSVLGKKGSLTGVLRGLGSLAPEERPAVGKTANEVRIAIEAALEERRSALSAVALEARVAAEAVDVTLPGRARPVGSRHLINRITAEVIDIFLGLGYQVAEGPEVELDYYNFTALNTPPDHPARSLADTFYVRDLSGDEAVVAGESRCAAAHAHLAGAGSHDGAAEAADLRARARQGLPARHRRPEPPAAVHADRGTRRRRGHHLRRPQGHARPLREGHLRARPQDAVPPALLPVHGALGGGRRELRHLRR